MCWADVWDALVQLWENEYSDAVAEDALYALTAMSDATLVNVSTPPAQA